MPVVFVHGITVRRERFDALLSTFQRHMAQQAPGLAVSGCYWGDLGLSLHYRGASIPGFLEGVRAVGAAMGADPRLQSKTLMALLLDEPYLELIALRDAEKFEGTGAGFAPLPANVEARNVMLDSRRPAIERALLESPGLSFATGTPAARKAVQVSVQTAFEHAGRADRRLSVADLLDPLTRCLAAALYQAAAEPAAGLDGEVGWTGVEELVQAILERELGGQRGWISDTVINAALSVATLAMREGLRRRVMGAMSLFVGDVLVYMARRADILQRLEESIAEAVAADSKPLWLVGHSLGGIICYDYCQKTVRDVARLVTVGSQVGLFGELGALASDSSSALAGTAAAVGNALGPAKLRRPAKLGQWLNIYDPDDMLCFLAEPVFDDVVDLEVDTQAPFPISHSEYWNRPDVYEKLTHSLV